MKTYISLILSFTIFLSISYPITSINPDDLEKLDILDLRRIANDLEKQAVKDIPPFKRSYPMPIFMEKEEIIEFIINGLKIIKEKNKITNNLIFLDKQPTQMSNIDNYLTSLPRESLETLTIELERYHRRALREENIMGGLHDYLKRIDNSELISYALREIEEHPELNDLTILEQLVNQNKFNFDKFLSQQSRANLIHIAIGLEKYHKKQTSTEQYLGGLHDYIMHLSEQEIKNFIFRELKCHPELDISSLQAFIQNEDNKNFENAKNKIFLSVKSIDEILQDANREKLELILNDLNRQVGGKYKYLMGNLHPFTNEDLKTFIKRILDENKGLKINDDK
jgi:hypothetical protein